MARDIVKTAQDFKQELALGEEALKNPGGFEGGHQLARGFDRRLQLRIALPGQ